MAAQLCMGGSTRNAAQDLYYCTSDLVVIIPFFTSASNTRTRDRQCIRAEACESESESESESGFALLGFSQERLVSFLYLT